MSSRTLESGGSEIGERENVVSDVSQAMLLIEQQLEEQYKGLKEKQKEDLSKAIEKDLELLRRTVENITALSGPMKGLKSGLVGDFNTTSRHLAEVVREKMALFETKEEEPVEDMGGNQKRLPDPPMRRRRRGEKFGGNLKPRKDWFVPDDPNDKGAGEMIGVRGDAKKIIPEEALVATQKDRQERIANLLDGEKELKDLSEKELGEELLKIISVGLPNPQTAEEVAEFDYAAKADLIRGKIAEDGTQGSGKIQDIGLLLVSKYGMNPNNEERGRVEQWLVDELLKTGEVMAAYYVQKEFSRAKKKPLELRRDLLQKARGILEVKGFKTDSLVAGINTDWGRLKVLMAETKQSTHKVLQRGDLTELLRNKFTGVPDGLDPQEIEGVVDTMSKDSPSAVVKSPDQEGAVGVPILPEPQPEPASALSVPQSQPQQVPVAKPRFIHKTDWGITDPAKKAELSVLVSLKTGAFERFRKAQKELKEHSGWWARMTGEEQKRRKALVRAKNEYEHYKNKLAKAEAEGKAARVA